MFRGEIRRVDGGVPTPGVPAAGFSVLELLVVVAIVATLVAIAIPNYLSARAEAQLSKAIQDLHTIAVQVANYEALNGSLPGSLTEVGGANRHDPWGNPYQYLRIRDAHPPRPGHWRKDRFLVPVNTDYDLYSMGPDGRSQPPLTAQASRDDVIRAGNGAYFGLAEEF